MSLRPVRSRRHRFSYRQRASLNSQWQSHWNWKPSRKNLLGLFGRKSFVIALSLLIILIGGLVMYSDPNNPLFHNIIANANYRDPQTLLWQSIAGNNNNQEFNTLLSSYVTGGNCNGGSTACLSQDPNSTTPSIAVSINPVDLSVVSGKELYIPFFTGMSTSGNAGVSDSWCWYLTRSSSIPQTNVNDKSVKFDSQSRCRFMRW